ncbi:C-type natriuretic peptide 3 precursor [Takifugu rubripes]|uniref:C-type natriuretic peptide 3 n=1 Tax=Takifugu rubripes TaxID=31033 RepID=ANFC3_TAKRU|nr:C-type natriuretic peptide 3 precursor [Takifugu rubripes]Q805D4.1 RecName: Full=C-type natriuretic peptide 3; Flags: Precursor [Takifugu rubripes]BAC57073.1 C-type natriuretic peptide-3 [Takifugu rubripes]|eukprot:NP_001027908.1 C-type natriuretic peptide 3 precursor [Takifugu rubripes]
MSLNLPGYALFFILLVASSGAKPAPDLQILEPPLSSLEEQEEMQEEVQEKVQEQQEEVQEKVQEQQEEVQEQQEEVQEQQEEQQEEVQERGRGTGDVLLRAQLDSSTWALQKDDVLMRLFKDLLRTSKRSRSRYKKGGLRSCFGVRLARIGSFSGLGC